MLRSQWLEARTASSRMTRRSRDTRSKTLKAVAAAIAVYFVLMRRVLCLTTCLALSAPAVAQRVSGRSSSAEIAFLCTRQGVDQVCAIDPATLAIRQVTTSGDPKGPPRWSPDRRTIAFHRRTGAKTDVLTMSANGVVRPITASDGTMLYRNPAWSPDGTQLAIECGKAPAWDICLVGANGATSARKVTHCADAGFSCEAPDWSPDGRRLAFQSNRDATPVAGPRGPIRGYDIFTMTVEGANVRRLSTTPAGRSTLNPAWSPDGSKLVAASTRDGGIVDWGLSLISPDDGSIQAVTHDRTPYGYGHPRWSRDGRFFVFHSNRDGAEHTTADVEVYVMAVDGTGMRRLTNNHEYDGFGDW